MSLLFCRAEPADIEDAAAAATMATAATAVAAPTLLKQPAMVQEQTSALPAMASGPHLSEAVQEATAAADAEMVPVPLSQQHASALSGPGINAAFLPGGHSSPTATLHASEVPVEEEGALQQEASTASVVAVAAAASTVVVASEWCADATGLCSASAISTSTNTGIAVVAGKLNDQDAGNVRPASSEGIVPGKPSAGLVSVTAASTLAEATSAFAAGKAEDATAVQSMQVAPTDRQLSAANEQAGTTGDSESSQLSSFTSQHYAADVRTDGTGDAASSQLSCAYSQQLPDKSSEQQGGAATDDGLGSNPAQGGQEAGGRNGNEDGSSLMPGSSMSLGPNVKQSVRRLEQIHAAMRNKA